MGFNADNADSNGGKGIVRDMRRIRAGSAMTAAELREFIRQFKGKSPQEVLGTVAQSGLSRAVGVATIGCVALVAVFTVLPYAWGKVLPSENKPERKPTAAPAAPAAAASEPRPAASPQTATAAPSPAVNAGQDLLEKLGEGDAKTSDPRSNPLEDSADDLLKDLK